MKIKTKTTQYIGEYVDSGNQSTFYKVKSKKYGFKSFPNKSLAIFAHSVQSHLAPLTAPKVYSPVCKIRVHKYIPNYFETGDCGMFLSDWGYLTEIAFPYRCKCNRDCANCDSCPHYNEIQNLLEKMRDNGIKYKDDKEFNLGYVKREKSKVLVAIDFGAESLDADDRFPEVCWDGANTSLCCTCGHCTKN